VTYGEIIDKAIIEVYGADLPQAEITANLYGSEGIISTVQRQIQEDNDLWFMLSSTTEVLVDAQAAYDIDYEFKKEIDLRVVDQDGTFYTPLTKIFPRTADTVQASETEPTHYWLDFSGGYRRFNLYPTPNVDAGQTRTLNIRFWKYLDKLPDNNTALEEVEDDLSIEAPYLIIYKVASIICSTIENYEKMQIMESRAGEQLQRLIKKDFQYNTANIFIPYRRL
jgi:hypothetical protein